MDNATVNLTNYTATVQMEALRQVLRLARRYAREHVCTDDEYDALTHFGRALDEYDRAQI